ncbi:MAG: ATP-binding protein [Thermodesulfobacteriota bacterium]
MSFFSRHMPQFWREQGGAEGGRPLFNYRRMWRQTVFVTLAVALIPLFAMAAINYFEYSRTLHNELIAPMDGLAASTARSVSFFLEERKSALSFVVADKPYTDLVRTEELSEILVHLKRAFGGFIDLGLIGQDGVQWAYSGPYSLEGKDYRGQEWFQEVVMQGVYISPVFTGFRRYPHFVIAVKNESAGGSYILRATIDTQTLTDLAGAGGGDEGADALIVSQDGFLQTPSRYYGKILEKFWFPVPKDALGSPRTAEAVDPRGERVIVTCQAVPRSPFVFVLVKRSPKLLPGWISLRRKLVGFFTLSALGIAIVVLAVCTFLVSRIFEADRRRAALLHKAEYTNKLASLGRLAAGVAHEINNPLAIINEKAGLLKDMIHIVPDFPNRGKAEDITDSILQSVERCSTITHRLLGFARHIDVSTETIYLDAMLKEVLGFLEKESQYRSISVALSFEENLAPIESDRGQLQQVFLNILNNAFAAVEDGGEIRIAARSMADDMVEIRISDNGCGISPENLKLIFEPFFTTKGRKGTGLGLSITYGIVQKLGGNIEVESRQGIGTTFIITLPRKQKA